MQEDGFETFSTERCIPNGMRLFQKQGRFAQTRLPFILKISKSLSNQPKSLPKSAAAPLILQNPKAVSDLPLYCTFIIAVVIMRLIHNVIFFCKKQLRGNFLSHIRRLFFICALTFFACLTFYLICVPVASSFYLKIIKRIDSIKETPFVLPIGVLSFPSEGTCYWSMPYWWADESVIWGRHSGISDIIEWSSHYDKLDKETTFWTNFKCEVFENKLSYECLQKRYSPFLSAKPKLNDISKEVPFAKDKYGELIFLSRSVDNSRQYIYCYIDDEYFYIYFSHFPSKEESWIKWMR